MKTPLLTGGDKNRCLKLWNPGWSRADMSQARVCAHEFTFKSESRDSMTSGHGIELLAHTTRAGGDTFLLLAAVSSPALYVMHISMGATAKGLCFTRVSELPLHEPVISAAILGDAKRNDVRFFCVQLNAIQCYHLPMGQCSGGVANAPGKTPGPASNQPPLRPEGAARRAPAGASEPSGENTTASAPGNETKECSTTGQPSQSQSAHGSPAGGESSGRGVARRRNVAASDARDETAESGGEDVIAGTGMVTSSDEDGLPETAGPTKHIAPGGATAADGDEVSPPMGVKGDAVSSAVVAAAVNDPKRSVGGVTPPVIASASSQIAQDVAAILVPELGQMLAASVKELARTFGGGGVPAQLAALSAQMNRIEKSFGPQQALGGGLSSNNTLEHVKRELDSASQRHIRGMVPTIGKGVAIAVSKTLQASLQQQFDAQRSEIAQHLSGARLPGQQVQNAARPADVAAQIESCVRDAAQQAFEHQFAATFVTSVEAATKQMFAQMAATVNNGLAALAARVDTIAGRAGGGASAGGGGGGGVSAAAAGAGRRSPRAIPKGDGAAASTQKVFTFCTSCGTRGPADDKFCAHCGAPRAQADCAGCGNALLPNAKFCPECGMQV